MRRACSPSGQSIRVAEAPGDHRLVLLAARGRAVRRARTFFKSKWLAHSGHLVLGEHTGAAAAYVGMTRGCTGNTAHLVAETIVPAREQWITTFTHDRADLGPAHAAQLAKVEARRYAPHRPLQQALAELHYIWTLEQDCLEQL